MLGRISGEGGGDRREYRDWGVEMGRSFDEAERGRNKSRTRIEPLSEGFCVYCTVFGSVGEELRVIDTSCLVIGDA
jgi:hypothetical protein